MSEAMRHASAAEVKHEIIALGDSVLALNEANWARFRKESESTVPTVVISFLGDTSAGKSHTIRELMGTDDGSSRPFVQPPSVQGAATTFNVNLYV